jgi:hypothetical protein
MSKTARDSLAGGEAVEVDGDSPPKATAASSKSMRIRENINGLYRKAGVPVIHF